MKAIGIAAIMTLFYFGTQAQEFEVPKNYKLENAKDFDTYEKDVINCVSWLANTPLNEQAGKRKEANAFLLQWLSGSSKVHIEIKQEIVTFMDNGDLLMIFMGSWAKYSIQTGDFNDKIKGTTAGLEAVIEFYTKNRGLIFKNKGAEKYLKMKEKGTLTEYIEENV